jgi:hypothetical protein
MHSPIAHSPPCPPVLPAQVLYHYGPHRLTALEKVFSLRSANPKVTRTNMDKLARGRDEAQEASALTAWVQAEQKAALGVSGGAGLQQGCSAPAWPAVHLLGLQCTCLACC